MDISISVSSWGIQLSWWAFLIVVALLLPALHAGQYIGRRMAEWTHRQLREMGWEQKPPPEEAA